MANKRQAKKQKKKQFLKLIPQSKEVKNLSFFELEKRYNYIVAEEEKRVIKERKKREKYQASLDLLHYKRESLKALGFDEKFLKTSYLRKVKKEDIDGYKLGNEYLLSIEKYPFLYDSHNFDYDTEFSIVDTEGKGLYIAWVDYSGEHTLDDIISLFSGRTNEELIRFLDGIVHAPCTYDKDAPNRGSGTSSGKAGGVQLGFFTNKSAKSMYDVDNMRIDTFFESHLKKRLHTGTNKHYQLAVSGDNFIITQISGRQLLILLNAIFYNITEDARLTQYEKLYSGLTQRQALFKKILPEP
jgi:hypothetical protein